MSIILKRGSVLLFGMVEKLRPLPFGWVYQRFPDCFVMALAPDGRQYYAGPDYLYRQKNFTQAEADRLNAEHAGEPYYRPIKAGDEYLDDTEVIEL